LPYPGHDIAENAQCNDGSFQKEQYESFLQVVDKYKMGIVCKVGARDRFVAKYLELGMCHALPIGDCPSYMPEVMKNLMVNVEGLNDDQIVQELTRLLNNPEELQQRTDAYTKEVERRYLSLPNMKRVVEEVKQTQ
jgi:hypothetical protein